MASTYTTNPYTMEQVRDAGGLAALASQEVKSASARASASHGLSSDFVNSDAFKYSNYVTAKEVASAEKQMAFQEEMTGRAMAYNSEEAEKNRKWQEYMSNTAHQREVLDLIKAGLNPVLSAMGGNGAAVTSGATASASAPQGSKATVDSSAMTALATEISKLLERQTSMQLQTEQLKTQMDIAKMQNSMQEFVAMLGADASKYGANMSAWSSRYVADMNYLMQQDFPSNWVRLISGNSNASFNPVWRLLEAAGNPDNPVNKAVANFFKGLKDRYNAYREKASSYSTDLFGLSRK